MGEIYQKGQVVIPQYIRRMFNLKPGDTVEFSVEDDRIVIEKTSDVLKEMKSIRLKIADQSYKETETAIKKAQKKIKNRWREHVC